MTCLPHIGSATHETWLAMAELATTKLLAPLAGERPAAVYTGEPDATVLYTHGVFSR